MAQHGESHRSIVFETERLVVRPWHPTDAARHFDIYSRDEVARWLGSVPRPLQSPEQSLGVIERWGSRSTPDGRFGIWAIEGRESGLVAGTVLLVPIPLTGEQTPRPPEAGGDVEVGWHLHPDSWGHGFATEAARGAIGKGFAEGLEEVVAVVRAANAPSLRLCRRLGMEETGSTDKWYGVSLDSFRIARPV